jgi:ribonuclease R
MIEDKEKTETRIMKLFGENYEKKFTFENLKGLLPKSTRREKLVHSLQILQRQKKIIEIDFSVYQLLPSAFTKTKPTVKSSSKKQEIVDIESDLNPKTKLTKEEKIKPFDIEGILDITGTGAMFVIIDGYDKDAIIRGNSIPAFKGDRILVRIDRHKEGKRPEAKFIKVIEYKLKSFIGKVSVSKSKDDYDVFFVSPLSAKASFDFYISSKFIKDAKQDDYVEIEFIEWNAKEKNPRGKVLEVLKDFNPNELEMRSILLEREFHQEFSDEVNAELEPIQAKLTEKDLANRLDLRDTLTITIDPKSARDFDDALSVKKIDNDTYQIGVHIADVSHYVKANTELDKEAYRRATSVYLPDRVAPMLPEKLSNDLCSLNPKVDRLAFSMIYTITTDGKITDEFLAKTIIHSDRRFSYEEAQVVIETGKGDHSDEIKILFDIAKIWRGNRFENGSINFHSSEVQFVLDENGKPIDVIQKIQREANWMIEEYMLRANISVAQALSVYSEKKLVPAGIYRDHDVPDMTKLEQFRESAMTLGGHKLKKFEKPDAAAKTLNAFLKSIEDLPESDILNQMAIRSMAKAYYSTVNIGHYGLAFTHYSHFTSPIRRYPDLLAHRLLTNVLRKNKISTTAAQLEEMCQHCSAQEKKATECEREGIKYKQVEYLSYKLKEEYVGIISGIRDGGFWVELKANKCEGYLDLSSNFKETFSFDQNALTLTGIQSHDKFYMGMELRIIVDKVDMEMKRVWFKVKR